MFNRLNPRVTLVVLPLIVGHTILHRHAYSICLHVAFVHFSMLTLKQDLVPVSMS